jgi:hypothetical protein
MELRRFKTLAEAEARYQRLTIDRGGAADAIFLALCRGDNERAQKLYRRATFPNRWWADVVYAQGHYLIQLRRRDRIIELARSLGVDTGLADTSDDPWKDLRAMAAAMEASARARASGTEGAILRCLLGHTYVAMDHHESAHSAYHSAVALDRSVWVSWDKTCVLEFLREEQGAE